MLLTDSYKTPLCLEYPAHSIAAGAIWLANRLLKYEDEGFAGLDVSRPWDLVFRTRMEDMEGEWQLFIWHRATARAVPHFLN